MNSRVSLVNIHQTLGCTAMHMKNGTIQFAWPAVSIVTGTSQTRVQYQPGLIVNPINQTVVWVSMPLDSWHVHHVSAVYGLHEDLTDMKRVIPDGLHASVDVIVQMFKTEKDAA